MRSLAHVTISVRDRSPLARDEAERRRTLRAISTVMGPRLLAFALPEEHLHSVLAAERMGLAARDLRNLLGRLRPDLELEPAHIEPIDDAKQLRDAVLYLLRQPIHHRLDVHAATFTGSCFPDLIGARLLPSFDRWRLHEVWPDFRLSDAFGAVELERVPLVPATDDELRRLGVGRLVELVAAVYALPPDLRGRSAPLTQGRALAAALTVRLERQLTDLADELRITKQSVWELARLRVDDRAVVAVRRLQALDVRARAESIRRSPPLEAG